MIFLILGKPTGFSKNTVSSFVFSFSLTVNIFSETVGYLLDETEQENLFKDPDMLKWLNEIEKIEKEDKNHILYAIDGLIKSVKLKNIAAL